MKKEKIFKYATYVFLLLWMISLVYRMYGPMPTLPSKYDRVEVDRVVKDGVEIEISDEQLNHIVDALSSTKAASVKRNNPSNDNTLPQCRVYIGLRFYKGNRSFTRSLCLGVDNGKKCYVHGIHSFTGYGLLTNGEDLLAIVL